MMPDHSIKRATSGSTTNSSGVPQGSIFGPFLVILYIKEVSLFVKCRVLHFADDINIFRATLLSDLVVSSSEWCSVFATECFKLYSALLF